MFLFCFPNDFFNVLDKMVDPSTQVIGRAIQIDIHCPVPLQSHGVTQIPIFVVWLKHIFFEVKVLFVHQIFNNKLKKVSASFLRIMFHRYARNRLETVFSASKIPCRRKYIIIICFNDIRVLSIRRFERSCALALLSSS